MVKDERESIVGCFDLAATGCQRMKDQVRIQLRFISHIGFNTADDSTDGLARLIRLAELDDELDVAHGYSERISLI